MARRRDIRRLRGAEREAHARASLERWRASGLNQVAFCRSEGIVPVTLARWRREFGGGAVRRPASHFVRVDLGEGTAGPVFELDLGAGRRLRVPPGFDAEDLARLLAVLGEGTC